MPLQNRSMPDGTLFATSARGLFMGNRGGRIHDPASRTLLTSRWKSKRWIICRTRFKDRHRQVMGNGYTEVFFLDEPTAIAAGHRPCFECRREAAKEFARCWEVRRDAPAGRVADRMDAELHKQRITTGPTIGASEIEDLPEGACVANEGTFWFKFGREMLLWSDTGYQNAAGAPSAGRLVTPPASIRALRAGYQPQWHPSAHDAGA